MRNCTGEAIISSKALLDQFRAHLRESALAPATVVNYLADLRAFLRWVERSTDGGVSPFHLGPSDIRAYCAFLQEQDHAPATINRRIQALRKFYTLARSLGWLEENPAEKVALLTEVASDRSRTLGTGDVARLLEAVQHTRPRYLARDWAIMQVFLGAGLKLGELTALRVGDIHLDVDKPHLTVRGPADQGGRTIPLTGEVLAAVQEYLRSRRAAPGVNHFFVNRDGNPLSSRSVQRLLHHYAAGARLDTLTTQALRYQYARAIYEDSQNLEAVARLLGHRHLATTIRYLRPTSEEE